MSRPRNRHAHLALSLGFEFQKYLMQHPKVARQIPPDAIMVFQLDGNPTFNRWALATARKHKGPPKAIVTVRVRSLTPPLSRIKAVELVC